MGLLCAFVLSLKNQKESKIAKFVAKCQIPMVGCLSFPAILVQHVALSLCRGLFCTAAEGLVEVDGGVDGIHTVAYLAHLGG